MATIRELGLLSAEVYKQSVAPVPIGTSVSGAPGWEVAAYNNDTGSGGSGSYSILYKKTGTTEYAVAIRGTANLVPDLLPSDGKILLGDAPDNRAAYQASQLSQFQEANPDARISVTGHSLGGLEASMVSSQLGVSATVFNAPNTPTAVSDSSRITEVHAQGDIVSNAGADFPQTIVLNTGADNALDLHKMDKLNDALAKNPNLADQEAGGAINVDAISGDADVTSISTIEADANGQPIVVQHKITAVESIRGAILEFGPTVGDALSLVSAIRNGEPLPVVTSGLNLINNSLNAPLTNSIGDPIFAVEDLKARPSLGLGALANTANAIGSYQSMVASYENGDNWGAAAAGASFLQSGAEAYAQAATAVGVEFGVGVATDIASGLSTALPYLNLANAISKAPPYTDVAIALVSMAFPVVGIIYNVGKLIISLTEEPPEAWGVADAVWGGPDGTVATVHVTGADNGDNIVSSVYDNSLASLQNIVTSNNTANPNFEIGIVANRLPTIEYQAFHGAYKLTETNPVTGAQVVRSYDEDFKLYGGQIMDAAGNLSPTSGESLFERFVNNSLARGAIAPMWEVQTAAQQTKAGDPFAGLTEEERAGRVGKLATDLGAATEQVVRAVGLDLDGSGAVEKTATKTVAFNVDDSGFYKQTEWLNNNDGFLFLDRNYNGFVDSGKELFNNATVALGQRGLRGMAWLDANYDGKITDLDPVFAQLKIWQDANGNGRQDFTDTNGNGLADAGEPNEMQSLSDMGITELNYAMGTFTQNGVAKQMTSTDLTADTFGETYTQADGGILIQNTNGEINLVVNQIDDQSVISPGQDGKTFLEDGGATNGNATTEQKFFVTFAVADLLANDTIGGLSGSQWLSITGVASNDGFGDAVLSADKQTITYTPKLNHNGAASFTYTVAAPTGQSSDVTVNLDITPVNDTPVVTVNQGNYDLATATVTVGGSYPKTTTGTAPVGGTPDTLTVHDVDDTAWTYGVSTQAQAGLGNVDANGKLSYTNWIKNNTPGLQYSRMTDNDARGSRRKKTYFYDQNLDSFNVYAEDAGGLRSEPVQVNAVHSGTYYDNLQGGGKKPISIDLDGNGFEFTDVNDSNIFFDVNGDGFDHRVSWPSAGDGLLALDANGNGIVDDGSEISFVRHDPNAQTDLEGLKAFDTNGDGMLSNLDARWSEFGVWNDANQDAVTDAGEFQSLDAMGISAINLTSDGQFQVVNGQTVHGVTQVEKTDGTILDAADVTLAFTDEVRITQTDGSTITAIKTPFAPSGGTITGTEGKDLILGDDGATVLQGLGGDDVFYGGVADDVIEGGAGNDIAHSGSGNDLVMGGNGDDIVFAGNGDDIVMGEAGADVIFGENGNDVMLGGSGNDLLSGDGGNDLLSGDSGNDQLIGGSGRDQILGGSGRDILDGGTGDDALNGGTGNDTYIFGRGSGNDVISDNDALVGNRDVIQMHSDVLPADIIVYRDSNNLYLEIRDSGDTLTIKNWFVSEADKVEQVYFNDGTVWNLDDQAALLDIPTEGNDFLVGDETNNYIDALSGDDTLIGLDGADVLIGGEGNDTLVGGQGNDTLEGGVGNDTYHFGKGSGQDTIYDYDTATANVDTIKLGADLTASDIKVTRAGVNLVLGIVGSADQVTLLDWYSNSANKVEVVEFADGTLWDVSTLATRAAEGALNAAAGNSTLTGTPNSDTLIGNAGNNLIDGLGSIDTMIGGAGNDTYIVENEGDLVIEGANAGDDNVLSSVSYTLADNVEGLTLSGSSNLNATGNAGDNRLAGNRGNNVIDGGAGADLMQGGVGDDTYIVDNVGDRVIENPNSGTDNVQSSISYKLTDNVENLTLSGSANISGEGNALDNQIVGNAGNNLLDGAAGADTLIGGAGHDVYVVDNAGDIVVEAADGGFDTVEAGFDYTLGDNVESLQMSGAADARGTGNDLNNLLIGNAGNNVLDGLTGADAMVGGLGDDTYVVDNVDDVVVEDLDAGVDTVLSSVDYTLTDDVENLTLTGANAINGTGNELENVIDGNDADNVIDGNEGADVMSGGLGNDTYVVDDAGDVVIEGLNAGIDNVQSDISYTLTDNVENLNLTGTEAINGTGNALDNIINGNIADNVLNGDAGNDILNGNDGADTLNGGDGADTLSGGLGDDVLNGDAGNDLLNGNDGNDILNGGLGDDVLNGDGGNDTLNGNDGADTLNGGLGDDVLNGDAGNDVLNGGDGADTLNGGLGDDVLNGDAGNDVLNGNDGNDTLNGGLGDDVLNGDAGNDLLNGGDGADTLNGGLGDDVLNGDAGNDLLNGGDGNDILNGGLGDDVLNGDAGNDVLNGGDGADTLNGGLGDDVLNGDAGNDLLNGNDGNDTLNGGLGDDVLNGDAGNDLLNGGDGADTLNGGLGDDVLNGDAGNDLLNGGDGNDILNGGLGDDVLNGDAGNDTLNGNDGADTLNGGLGDDVLNGDAGNDLLNGGDGADTLNGGLGDDVLNGDAGNDLLNGGDGGDTLNGGLGDDVLNGDAGNDLLNGGDGADTLNGGLGDDVLNGDAGNDLLNGGDGADTLNGGLGDDVLNGDAGNDVLNGNDGNDTLNGGLGDDVLNGDAGNDLLNGNDGNDILNGGLGDDVLNGDGGNDTLNGNDGADTLNGGLGDDVLNGDAGNDLLNGGDGADTLNGGLGDDVLNGDAGNDLLNGGDGADTLNGGLGDDVLNGDAGNDLLNGGDGNDILNGGLGDDVLNGDAGNDTLNGNDGADTLNGGLGDDVLNGDAGNDLVNGNDGNDILNGGLGDDVLNGDGGNDTLNGNDGADTLNGGLGDDVLNGDAGNDLLNGGDGADTLNGGLGDDVLNGDAGNDLLNGNDGNDTLNGGLGDDVLNGDAGNDVLNGGDGADTLNGGLGDDVLNGDAGNDLLNGNDGNDILNGGLGDDVLNGDAGNDLLNGNDGADTLNGGLGDDVLNGDAGNDLLNGNDGADTLNGGLGDDVLNGNAGNDELNGGDGADTLNGGLGDDVLNGDAGNDLLNGGDGADTLNGGLGDDVLNGDAGNDLLNGGDGNDILNGGLGDDVLNGDAGNDTLNGNDGADTLNGGLGDDVLNGDAGNDLVNGNDGADTLNGGLGDDVLNGDAGNDLVNGNDGNDILNGGLGDDVLNGDAGNDLLNGGDGADTLNGGLGDDVLNGDAGNDTLNGNDGADTLNGGLGDDILNGDAGNDLLNGGDGADTLNGGLGDDVLNGDAGNDELIGGLGIDILYGGDGNDTLIGSVPNVIDLTAPVITDAPEHDSSDERKDSKKKSSDNRDDKNKHGEDEDSAVPKVFATPTDNNILDGGAGNDTIIGGTENDFMVGGKGNDEIYTGLGSDIIAFNAGDGNDVIHAHNGANHTLSLGGGIELSDLSLRHADDDLVIEIEGHDSITLSDWYASEINQSISSLQLIGEEYVKRDKKEKHDKDASLATRISIQTIDFVALVDEFDSEPHSKDKSESKSKRNSDSESDMFKSWSLTHAKLDNHLETSDTEALGGDMSVQYALDGTTTTLTLIENKGLITDPKFANDQQLLQKFG